LQVGEVWSPFLMDSPNAFVEQGLVPFCFQAGNFALLAQGQQDTPAFAEGLQRLLDDPDHPYYTPRGHKR